MKNVSIITYEKTPSSFCQFQDTDGLRREREKNEMGHQRSTAEWSSPRRLSLTLSLRSDVTVKRPSGRRLSAFWPRSTSSSSGSDSSDDGRLAALRCVDRT